jgi:hypothetical protein
MVMILVYHSPQWKATLSVSIRALHLQLVDQQQLDDLWKVLEKWSKLRPIIGQN